MVYEKFPEISVERERKPNSFILFTQLAEMFIVFLEEEEERHINWADSMFICSLHIGDLLHIIVSLNPLSFTNNPLFIEFVVW